MSLADVREFLHTTRSRATRHVERRPSGSIEAELNAIEDLLDQADDHVASGRFHEAIGDYARVRVRAYRLINNRRGEVTVPNLLEPPHLLDRFDDFLDGGAALLGRLERAAIDGSGVDVGIDDGTIARTDALGIHYDTGSSVATVRGRSGLEAALAGRHDVAIADFSAALEAADERAEGALRLNLGAVLLQSGEADAAIEQLESAAEAFDHADDALGAAQARQNLAVLHASQGRADEAKALFERSEVEARRAAGRLSSASSVLDQIGRRTSELGERIEFPATGGSLDGGAMPGIPGRIRLNVLPGAVPLTLDARTGGRDTAIARAGSIGDLGGGLTLALRDPDDGGAFHALPLAGDFDRTDSPTVLAGFIVGSDERTLKWTGTGGPGRGDLVDNLYEPRRRSTTLEELVWRATGSSDTAARLAHIYYFESALGRGDAHAGLEEWETARRWYRRAADYRFLNDAHEAPLLWHRIALAYLGEGDDRYRDDDPVGAAAAYGRVLAPDDLSAPVASLLYEHAALRPVGELVPALLADPGSVPNALGAGTAATVLDIAQRLAQIGAGLDWFGVARQFLPPFTFDHLQRAARFLAQQAKSAERDYMQFTERHESSQLTKTQLEHAAASARAEHDVVLAQRAAARREVTVAERAQRLAERRAADARTARDAYAAMSAEQIALETSIAWYSSQNSWELDNAISGRGPDAGRHVHEVIAERRQRLGTISREHELLRMGHTIGQLNLTGQQAAAQVRVAEARARAADFAVEASALRAGQAAELVAQFNAATFTPELWWRLASFMRRHAARYLHWATRVARLMERAYEFEHDIEINRIRADYDTGVALGLLGADQLLGDIDYYTFHRLTETGYRYQRVSTRLSLAERFPFAFQTELRQRGKMTFEIGLDDIERSHPGSFNQRIQSIEVAFIGPVPREGVSGTLRCAGVSEFRRADGESKFRIQDVETLVLSAHTRPDAAAFRPRPELLDVFEGTGLASSWTIEIPPASNDLDFEFLVDVELVFHYEAGFDRALEERLRAIEPPPEATRASTSFSLRWDMPDRFFLLQSGGEAALEIEPAHLPRHHLDPVVRSVSLVLLATEGEGSAVAARALALGAPGVAAVDLVSDANGRVASATGALAALTGRAVEGTWPLRLGGSAEERARVYDVLLFVEYDYTARRSA